MVQANSVRKKLFIITGPTAIGKSGIAVKCAQKFGNEIISADSMQIYKKLDIGTGKITQREMCGVRHHLIDIIEPNEEYSVEQFVVDATEIIDKSKKIPIITGGTGLYIFSLLNGANFGTAPKDPTIREKWNNILSEKGKEYVYAYLKKIDAISAEKISIEDTKRVIRAIEIYEITGSPKSSIVNANKQLYDAKTVVLYNDDRQALYESINARVDKMFDSGLVDEVKKLLPYKDCQSMQAIGYKEVVAFLEGKITLEESKELVKKNSRNYAKRQMTYFRGMNVENKFFVKYDDFAQIYSVLADF